MIEHSFQHLIGKQHKVPGERPEFHGTPMAERSAPAVLGGPGQWKDFDGEYSKQFYDVMLPDGKMHFQQWPNAGGFMIDGVMYTENDNIRIRRSAKERL